ncbi:hypothetical protein [Flavobacterium pectinovorum]|uniref:Uncharacterized protein n=1 Tax=Flavobacterium pectinovorum TaxID=29533 RepID=A0A502ECE5_9FLAO|nr:hypothetical protein [Flavobacterium pectinovorum]TPG35415.1 hypothetical protein EAH81_21910 [Flavobacterium pectinovorum]
MVSKEMSKEQQEEEVENLMDDFHPITESNTAEINRLSSQIYYKEKSQKEDFYKDADFVNKDCKSLDDFIINADINAFDLRKLADLNGIALQISEGWYPLTIELIRKLHDNGWDKRVHCIKSKYALLEFYASNEDHLYKIIWDYGYRSQTVCETCGEKGEMRSYSGWDYIDCRKHYLEKRRKITIDNEGFTYNGFYYYWNTIIDRSFENLDFNGKYRTLIIEFKKDTVQNEDLIYGKLYISKNAIGFGNFLNYLSKNFFRLANSYVTKFENVEFCEICGYKAVYLDECECCEYTTRQGYLKRWSEEKNSEEEKFQYIKDRQIWWIEDEGEIYETKQKNYIKNPDYKVL